MFFLFCSEFTENFVAEFMYAAAVYSGASFVCSGLLVMQTNTPFSLFCPRASSPVARTRKINRIVTLPAMALISCVGTQRSVSTWKYSSRVRNIIHIPQFGEKCPLFTNFLRIFEKGLLEFVGIYFEIFRFIALLNIWIISFSCRLSNSCRPLGSNYSHQAEEADKSRCCGYGSPSCYPTL